MFQQFQHINKIYRWLPKPTCIVAQWIWSWTLNHNVPYHNEPIDSNSSALIGMALYLHCLVPWKGPKASVPPAACLQGACFLNGQVKKLYSFQLIMIIPTHNSSICNLLSSFLPFTFHWSLLAFKMLLNLCYSLDHNQAGPTVLMVSILRWERFHNTTSSDQKINNDKQCWWDEKERKTNQWESCQPTTCEIMCTCTAGEKMHGGSGPPKCKKSPQKWFVSHSTIHRKYGYYY